MFKKAYILNFDINGKDFDQNKFHNNLIKMPGIIGWWHYLQSSYVLIVEYNTSASSLTNSIMKLIPNKEFFVCELKLSDHDGWLPKEAWDWLAKNK